MNRVKYLFVLFILLQYSTQMYSQEISFYYDKIADTLSSQIDSDYLIENLTRQIWNESSATWVNDSLLEYSYNDQNLLDTFITHKWRYGTTWGNEYKATFNYNVNNKLILKTDWSGGGGWGETSRYYYYYYGNGNLLSIDFHSLVNGGWRYLTRTVYSWNEYNLVTMIAIEGLYIFYNYWGPSSKEEFSYDSTNSLIMKERFVYYAMSYWRRDLRDLYSSDDNGNRVENIRQDWNDTDSTWVNDYQYLYEYNLNNELLTIVYQDWQQDSLDWKNIWRETYTYTPQNKPATMYKDTWTPETGWNNYVLRTYTYDANYNWFEKITFLWDGTNYKNYYRHLATWLEPVSVEQEELMSNSYYLFNNYPNPFNPSTKIKFTIAQSPLLGGYGRGGLVTLKVYDILGNEVATLVNEEKTAGEYEIEFSGSELPSGIYFYTLRAGNFFQTKKMILLK